MSKRILIISGSPKRDGNTATLVKWFTEGALSSGAKVETVNAATRKLKSPGCTSCRACQGKDEYGCVIDDDASAAVLKMTAADVIVMATPLYFFSASAQLKAVFDRMFSLYKWDNEAGTMRTVLNGKTLVLIASAFEAEGLDDLAKPFSLTAEYSGMGFESLLVPNAGVSGEIKDKPDIKEKAVAFGKKIGAAA